MSSDIHFTTQTELSSASLGASILSISDEFFAEAFHLLLTKPAQSLKGQFGPNGALYDGWETRRHNPNSDWAIIKLGTTGSINGFDIDTSHFNGNEAPAASVQILYIRDGEVPPEANDARWTLVLPQIPLGPSARHFFAVRPETQAVNYVKLNIHPDGGIARFRVYGNVTPVHPKYPGELFDMAHVYAGGRVVFTSDQHFGVGSNLILPGRGKDMSDGWETKRSRQPGHKDWAIIKLGAAGHLSHVVIDTANFKGNFPQSCELHAINSVSDIPPHPESHSPPSTCYPSSENGAPTTKGDEWTLVLPQVQLGPHHEHYFQLESAGKSAFTHVRLSIFPDGGVKRVRVFGSNVPIPGEEVGAYSFEYEGTGDRILGDMAVEEGHMGLRKILALPLTPEAFAPYGQVIQSYTDITSAPRSVKITPANFGTATKYHKLSLLESSYPGDAGATTGISVYMCQPVEAAKNGTKREVLLKALERHQFTNQAFVPMSQDGDKVYLVVVAKNGPDDRPDIGTLSAFVARGNQGITYNTGIWHQPMTVLDGPMDLACVETQIGNGEAADCEVIEVAPVIVQII